MEIRPATMSDVTAIASLLSEMRGHVVAPEDITSSLEKIVQADDREALLLVDDGQPLGFTVVNIVHKLPKQEVRVDEVIIAEKARGRGLGTELLHGAEAWASQHGGDVIEFTSRPSRESANHLYQKLGYHIRETNVYQKKKGEY